MWGRLDPSGGMRGRIMGIDVLLCEVGEVLEVEEQSRV
jgi:hypothetical protein